MHCSQVLGLQWALLHHHSFPVSLMSSERCHPQKEDLSWLFSRSVIIPHQIYDFFSSLVECENTFLPCLHLLYTYALIQFTSKQMVEPIHSEYVLSSNILSAEALYIVPVVTEFITRCIIYVKNCH